MAFSRPRETARVNAGSLGGRVLGLQCSGLVLQICRLCAIFIRVSAELLLHIIFLCLLLAPVEANLGNMGFSRYSSSKSFAVLLGGAAPAAVCCFSGVFCFSVIFMGDRIIIFRRGVLWLDFSWIGLLLFGVGCVFLAFGRIYELGAFANS